MPDIELQQNEKPTLKLTDENIARFKMADYFRRHFGDTVEPGDLELIDLPPHVMLMKNQFAFTYRLKIKNITTIRTIVFSNRKGSALKQTGEIMGIHER